MWGMWKISFHPNRAFWRLNLTTRTSCEFESQANCLARLEFFVLYCSSCRDLSASLHAPHVCHFSDFPVARSSRETPLIHASWVFFTLSHTQPLHKIHLNTGYLIAKLQANLAQNKANTWLNKFNLTISKLWGVTG